MDITPLEKCFATENFWLLTNFNFFNFLLSVLNQKLASAFYKLFALNFYWSQIVKYCTAAWIHSSLDQGDGVVSDWKVADALQNCSLESALNPSICPFLSGGAIVTGLRKGQFTKTCLFVWCGGWVQFIKAGLLVIVLSHVEFSAWTAEPVKTGWGWEPRLPNGFSPLLEKWGKNSITLVLNYRIVCTQGLLITWQTISYLNLWSVAQWLA